MPFNHDRTHSVESMLQGMVEAILEPLSKKSFKANLMWGNGSTIRALTDVFLLKLEKIKPDLSGLKIFAQDTWGKLCENPVADDDPRAFEHWYREGFFLKLTEYGFKLENAFFPQDAYPADFVAEPGQPLPLYDKLIEAHGGIDIAVIVPGPHGHVAFAETGYAADAEWLNQTSICCVLTPESKDADKDYPGCGGNVDNVPDTAPTITPGTLVKQLTRDGLLVVGARGSHNAANVLHMINGPIGPDWPISFVAAMPKLRPDVTTLVFTDPGARTLLAK